MSEAIEFAELDVDGRRFSIEYEWVGAGQQTLVFLHEGLGSRAMWKQFPADLCAALGCRGLLYSRPGYGASSPRADGETWPVDFMHQQAHRLLPALLAQLGIDVRAEPPWLFGHSDGASIALLYAARFPEALRGLIVLAPHIRVETLCISSIEQARRAYRETDLRKKLARYHQSPDSTFYGWNDVWLDPAFRQWSIETEIESIRCPVLAIQGVDDEYGTLEQIRGIARRVRETELLVLDQCGHSPQRDQPAKVIESCRDFVRDRAPGKGVDGLMASG